MFVPTYVTHTSLNEGTYVGRYIILTHSYVVLCTCFIGVHTYVNYFTLELIDSCKKVSDELLAMLNALKEKEISKILCSLSH